MVTDMAYPEPIPPMSPKEGKEFLQRLQKFSLSPKQKAFWANADKTSVDD